MYELAIEADNCPTQVMLQWFITEQAEEEKDAEHIGEMLAMLGDLGEALVMMNLQLA